MLTDDGRQDDKESNQDHQVNLRQYYTEQTTSGPVENIVKTFSKEERDADFEAEASTERVHTNTQTNFYKQGQKKSPKA